MIFFFLLIHANYVLMHVDIGAYIIPISVHLFPCNISHLARQNESSLAENAAVFVIFCNAERILRNS